MPLHRSQILLEEGQYQTLVRLAGATRRSISEVARELIDLALQSQKAKSDRRARALVQLDEIREEQRGRHGLEPGDPVTEARADREHELP